MYWAGSAGIILFSLVAPFGPNNAWKLWLTLTSGVLLLVAPHRRISPYDLPIALLLLSAAAAAFFSPDRALSFFPRIIRGDGVLVWLVYGLAVSAIANLDPLRAVRLLSGLLFLGLAQSVLALVETAGWFPVLPDMINFHCLICAPGYGTLGNVMFYSGAMALLLPSAVTAGAVGTSLGILAGVLVANERFVWIGLGAGAIALVAKRQTRVIWAVIGLVPLLLTRRLIHAGLPWVDFLPRLTLWQIYIPLIAKRPWGYGVNILGVGNPFDRLLYDNPHNEILYVASAFGVAALACYLWIWGVALRSTWKAKTRTAAGIFAGLIAYGVWALTGWGQIGTANILWSMLGLAISLGHRERRAH